MNSNVVIIFFFFVYLMSLITHQNRIRVFSRFCYKIFGHFTLDQPKSSINFCLSSVFYSIMIFNFCHFFDLLSLLYIGQLIEIPVALTWVMIELGVMPQRIFSSYCYYKFLLIILQGCYVIINQLNMDTILLGDLGLTFYTFRHFCLYF